MGKKTMRVPATKDYDLEVNFEDAPTKTGVGKFVFNILKQPITIITPENTTVESVNLKGKRK
jgi:hypothetical protein